MLRNTPNNESIIVEYGFLDSSGDDVDQLKNNWKELTESVVKGLANYIGVPYTPPVGTTIPSTGNYYIVQSGDTLYGISRNFGISVDALKSANNLTSNTLSIGMKLVIPSNQEVPTTNIYIVKPGDTLYNIAKLYGISVDTLKNANNKASNMLTIGESLKIPTSEQMSSTSNMYTVKSGDTLYSIANKYGVTVNALMNANNKTSSMLSLGEKLIIPTTSGTGVYHTVRAGDTLWAIAMNYNTTVDAIKKLNGLTSNNLTIGKILKVF